MPTGVRSLSWEEPELHMDYSSRGQQGCSRSSEAHVVRKFCTMCYHRLQALNLLACHLCVNRARFEAT